LPHRYGEGVESCRSRRTWHRSNWGFPGTWESLPSPPECSAFGGWPTNSIPGPPSLRSWAVGAKHKTHRVVPPSEGNEVRRDGLQAVVAPHSTAAPGEPVPRGPWQGRGRLLTDPWAGNTARALYLDTVSTQCPRITRREVKPWGDEPYAPNVHVRVRGSPGWVTVRGHPARLHLRSEWC
jgi:hypothetical protein